MLPISIDPQFLAIFLYYFPKLVYATICGALVGFEREVRHKSAGMKTNIIICVGSTLFTCTTIMLAQNAGQGNDVTRGIAQIISGIGFLGAGSIIKDGNSVSGLTTASFIWFMGAIGVMIGSGHGFLATLVTIGFVIVTLAIGLFEDKFLRKRKK